MRRLVLGAVLVLLLATGIVTVATAVPDAQIVVSDAEPRQDTITAGTPAPVDVTVDLGAGSASAVTLDQVAIHDEDGEVLANATDLGTLGQGGSLTVPVTVTFDDPGHRDLQVVAVATDEEEQEVNATRPLGVVVEETGPLVDVDPVEATVGTGTTLDLAVRNPSTEQLRNLTVTVAGDGVDIRTEQRSIATLASGETVERSFEVVPEASGDRTLNVVVRYATADGTPNSTERTAIVTAVDPVADLGVRVTRLDDPEGAVDEPDGDVTIPGDFGGILGGAAGEVEADPGDVDRREGVAVTATNFGNAPAERIVVTPRIENETLPRLSIDGPLAPGESDTVRVDLTDVDSGEVTFDVTYVTSEITASTSVDYAHRVEQGDVTLTGADIERIEDDSAVDTEREKTVRLSANLGNPTDQQVAGAVVSVVPEDHVEPAYPRRDYFVGTLEPGEFAPFDVTAAVDGGNATSVTLEVSFRTDGDIETRTFDLPYDQAYVAPDTGDADESITAEVAAVVAIVLALLVALTLVLVRRR